MLTTEELLKPRYKVITDYFYNPYKIGDIITVMYEDRSVHLTTTRYRDEFGEMVGQHNYFHPGELKNFPHLFQPLPWWSDREVSEMPEYVKHINGSIHKVREYESDGARMEESFWGLYKNLQPATLSDYEQYLQQKG